MSVRDRCGRMRAGCRAFVGRFAGKCCGQEDGPGERLAWLMLGGRLKSIQEGLTTPASHGILTESVSSDFSDDFIPQT